MDWAIAAAFLLGLALWFRKVARDAKAEARRLAIKKEMDEFENFLHQCTREDEREFRRDMRRRKRAVLEARDRRLAK